jgi:hypothetical protein
VSFWGAVVVGLPTGGSKGAGTVNASDYFINGQPFDFATVLPITGGTLTGPLVLKADPGTALGAATKQYVDAAAAAAGTGIFLPLTGGTLTGALTLPAAPPATALNAATKQYVDGRTPITTDAPSDSNYYGRYNGTWAIAPGGLADSPHDGTTYGRNNGAWSGVLDGGSF